MRVLTICGTRPEIIRLSRVIAVLDRTCEHVLAYTGQNSDPRLSTLFFDGLSVRAPDLTWQVPSTGFAPQAAEIFVRAAETFERVRPDRVLVLGDTNSALAAVVAARMGIPIYHMEAGNRCYDNRVPEEVNRRIIDHCSTVLMPYTSRSRDNLLREGISSERIFVTGNPIFEVIDFYRASIDASRVHEDLGVAEGRYFLVTLHRAENVDDAQRLRSIVEGLDRLAAEFGAPVLISTHPRTADKLRQFGVQPTSPLLRLLPPFGFFEFVRLERHARLVLSDSGTVQEECAIFGVPNVTLRDVTERPETIECGSNMLTGTESDRIVECARVVLGLNGESWSAPPEYRVPGVSHTVAKILLGHREPNRGL
jgi:UDP-N-acetylglucosamine 2-epimerase (non-hydrolysing)